MELECHCLQVAGTSTNCLQLLGFLPEQLKAKIQRISNLQVREQVFIKKTLCIE